MTASSDPLPEGRKRSDERVPALDGLRGLAIVMVVLWHYLPPADQGPIQLALGPLRSLIFAGWSGVDLFFVLSGFLIGGILIDRRDSANFYGVFFRRRIARIFPVYYALLASGLVIGALTSGTYFSARVFENGAIAFWPHLFFLQNFFMVTGFGAQWLGATWSLAIEEQFYVLFPFVVRATPPRRLFLVVVVLLVSAPILRYVVIEEMNLGRSRVLLFCRWDALAAGVGVALLVRGASFVRAARLARLTLLPLLALALLFVSTGMADEVLGRTMATTLRHTALLAFYAALLIRVLDEESRIRKLFDTRVLRFFGTISYALYVLHVPILDGLHAAIVGKPPSTATALGAVLSLTALALAIGASALSTWFFEMPILRMARRARYVDAASS